jgi:hypothetical protein
MILGPGCKSLPGTNTQTKAPKLNLPIVGCEINVLIQLTTGRRGEERQRQTDQRPGANQIKPFCRCHLTEKGPFVCVRLEPTPYFPTLVLALPKK